MWKNLMSGACLWLLLSAFVFAQCPGGGCPNPGSNAPIDIGNLPPVYDQGRQYGAVKPEGHLLSTVRIIAMEGNGMALGTGVYVNYEGLYVVITANHVIKGSNRIFVVFKNNSAPKTVQAVVVSADTMNDVAVLGLYQHPVDGEDIAAKMAYADDVKDLKNQVLQNAGFGGDTVLYAGSGKIIRYLTPHTGLPKGWMEISSYCRQGDSGGPIYLPNGKVVGILWGRDPGSRTIVASRPEIVHVQLQQAKAKIGVEETQAIQTRPPARRQPPQARPQAPSPPRLLPWRDKIENDINDLKKAPRAQPQPPRSGPNVDIDIKPAPPAGQAPPALEGDGRYRVDRHVAVPIILGLVLISVVIGVVVQWKKTYSI